MPSKAEIANCAEWFERELAILKPRLVIAVGRLAIEQFIAMPRLDCVVGRRFEVSYAGRRFDLVPLPHPSGASPWHRMEPGKTLLLRGLEKIRLHPAMRDLKSKAGRIDQEPGFCS